MYILSIDQSTQGTKVLLLNDQLEIVNQVFRKHEQIINERGWVSHDPNEIYDNLLICVKEVINQSMIDSNKIVAVGITNQRETSVIWDKDTGKPIVQSVVWQCERASSINSLISSSDAEYIKKSTGLDNSPYYPAAKISWLLNETNNYENQENVRFGTMDSYLIYRLTNGKSYKTDYSNASRTQLFNLNTLSWDEKICEMFHIDCLYLAEVCDSDDIFGYTTFEGILEREIPIKGVLGDSHAALYAQQCFEEGDAKSTYGSGSSIMMNTGSNVCLSKKGLSTSIGWKINNEVTYVLEGNINYTGALITWIQNLGLIKDSSETEKFAYLASKNDSTYIVPSFTGLGAPHWVNDAQAIMCGMRFSTGKNEIVKAALEAIAYQINDVVTVMNEESNSKIKVLKVDGGPTSNNYLMQFQTDILNTPIKISEIKELSAYGVAMIASELFSNINNICNLTYKILEPNMTEELRSNKIEGWKKSLNKVINCL